MVLIETTEQHLCIHPKGVCGFQNCISINNSRKLTICKWLRRDYTIPDNKAPSETTGVCQRCDGKGFLRSKEKDEQWTSTQTCPDCKGTGKQSGAKGEVVGQQTECNHDWVKVDDMMADIIMECRKCGAIK